MARVKCRHLCTNVEVSNEPLLDAEGAKYFESRIEYCARYLEYVWQNRLRVVNDFRDREYYHEINNFARLHSMHGRMAVFKGKDVSFAELDAAIDYYSTDFR